jgi:aminoglycoside phosphotransferase family enzyme
MNLIAALQQSSVYPHAVAGIEMIETHISWVFLTGDFAYKLKKPVNFGFLDFSTLEKRRFYCQEEIRLNKRLAPELYVDVVALSEVGGRITINGEGNVIEYVVCMRQFFQDQQFD